MPQGGGRSRPDLHKRSGVSGGEAVQVESSTAGAENYLDGLRQENRRKDPSAEGRTARTGTTGAIA